MKIYLVLAPAFFALIAAGQSQQAAPSLVTAASFGAYAARTLPNSVVVTIPNVAHVAFGSPSPDANTCAYVLTRSFFDVLKRADTSCVRRVPRTKFEIR